MAEDLHVIHAWSLQQRGFCEEQGVIKHPCVTNESWVGTGEFSSLHETVGLKEKKSAGHLV